VIKLNCNNSYKEQITINNMADEKQTSCCGGDRLIFSCSGGADVGELADRTSRELSREGFGKMFCLAGVGGDVAPIVEKTKTAKSRLIIDGCPVACAKKLLDSKGIVDYQYVQLNNLGYEKGKTPVTAETIGRVVAEVRKSYS